MIGEDARTPRGTKPDAVGDGTAYLIKACRHLRLTYQIRLVTALATDQGLRVELRLRRGATVSRDLDVFTHEHADVLRITHAS